MSSMSMSHGRVIS
uniref:Uncharacterized protein n=1 Tax=Arundo donax TaxID=35708 RepID=A0A0A8YI89_ARUDO